MTGMARPPRLPSPLAISVLLLAALTAWFVWSIYDRCGGRLVYALDDAYIHMAMAKNLILHHELGVGTDGFTSSSSSIIWPLLLAAAYLLTGVNEWWPLVLNFVCAVVLLTGMDLAWRRAAVPAWIRLALLTAAIFFVPIVPMVCSGMEHLLHACTTILFMAALYAVLIAPRPAPRESSFLLVTAVGVCLARFEGLFIVAAVCLVLLVEHRRSLAVSTAVAGLIAPTLFGLYSVSRGWFLLPNSVLLKASTPDAWTVGSIIEKLTSELPQRLQDAPFLLGFMLVASVLMIVLSRNAAPAAPGRSALPAILTVYVISTLLHLLFARIGWFLRYEAYLVALGLFVLGLAASEWSALRAASGYSRLGLVACALLLALPLAWRGVWGLRHTVQAAGNIYSQQYQMALFLKSAYPTGRVIMNDIGAAGFLTDTRLLDVSGLADMDMARARRAGRLDQEALRRFAAKHNAQIAVVYPAPFIPEEWIEVSRWKIFDNVVCWHDVVSIMAVDPTIRDDLVARLREFVRFLPPDVGYQIAGEAPNVPPGVTPQL